MEISIVNQYGFYIIEDQHRMEIIDAIEKDKESITIDGQKIDIVSVKTDETGKIIKVKV